MVTTSAPRIAIRSYNRSGDVRTLRLFPDAEVWVPESQEADYRRTYGEAVRTVPDDEDGSWTRKSNAVLRRTGAPVLLLDDDLIEVACFDQGDRYFLSPDDLRWLVAEGFALASEVGAPLWGIRTNVDPMGYRCFAPFNLLAPILGPWQGVLVDTVRFDPGTEPKGDYDFWLEMILRYRKTLRLNKYGYRNDVGKKAGGMSSTRTHERELAGAEAMKAKWGRVYRLGGSAGGKQARGAEQILNSQVKVPLKGC